MSILLFTLMFGMLNVNLLYRITIFSYGFNFEVACCLEYLASMVDFERLIFNT